MGALRKKPQIIRRREKSISSLHFSQHPALHRSSEFPVSRTEKGRAFNIHKISMARCEENRIASRRIARRPGPGVIVRGLTARNTARSRCVKRWRARARARKPAVWQARALSRPFSKDPVRGVTLGWLDASFRPEKRVPPTMPVLASAVWALSGCTRTRRISLCPLFLSFSLFSSTATFLLFPISPPSPIPFPSFVPMYTGCKNTFCQLRDEFALLFSSSRSRFISVMLDYRLIVIR